ncbi:MULTISPECIES: hypothetical protein [Bacillaceae]|nr:MULTISPECIES: hypothetical protein [Bacillaceae]
MTKKTSQKSINVSKTENEKKEQQEQLRWQKEVIREEYVKMK